MKIKAKNIVIPVDQPSLKNKVSNLLTPIREKNTKANRKIGLLNNDFILNRFLIYIYTYGNI
jgi:hypothetical protein